ncbi:cullin family protein [Aspergillus clavatus NRRL 1]|uniref:SCF ubiquitin ligase subunit CulC, putative n=1 Tax=Aspergillus clavatus (strain ATCC 1007 / CBS 513.65 / DSM 816 / NCTC 3887 / NRRL 1 / QM 1276 / 107) TaxID=344612 RepID=A1CTB7_ASPCL|nr:SCF ubiquitin ligase subunit CulC, putative [Aspergillus clavatus NRRL 1]EAW06554.1 SCF ubiquitin ligase subunit CulC, putative [Aspergillus clavatus NRRL 1]
MAMRARHKIRAPRRSFDLLLRADPTGGSRYAEGPPLKRGFTNHRMKGLNGTKSDDFDTIWGVLSSSLNEIHTKNASALSFEELYRNAYKIVLMTRGDDLYERVKKLEEEWLGKEVKKTVTAAISPTLLLAKEPADMQDQANERREAGERFLAVLKGAWEDHQLCMGMITDVLMYMDRIIMADFRKPSIYVASMALFRDQVLRSPISSDAKTTVADVLESTVLFMIQLERAGHVIDRPLIRHCIYMLEGLYETITEEETSKLYLTMFEPAFLETSKAFYQAEGQRLLELADAASFCRIASSRIAEEKERCHYTLSPLTEQKIKNVLDEELIARNIAEVINLEGTGVKNLIDNDRLDILREIYELSARVDNKKTPLTAAVQKRISQMGREVNTSSTAYEKAPSAGAKATGKSVSGEKKPAEKERPVNQQTVAAIKWVDDILDLKKKFESIWEKAFMCDQSMQSAITTSFSDFINSNARSSEFLSLFFDENLKKGIKGKTESEVDALLDNGITLLRYIKDKDLFETYYKKHLSRRLLMKRSASMDAERQMISKMKMEVGNQFTQRLEAMFKDMTISEDLSASYKDHIRKTGDPDQKRVDLEINVLTSTMWPMEIMSNPRDGDVQLPCLFPKEVEGVRQSFEQFYLSKHNGRKLSWQPNMGTADIRATFQRSNGKVQRHELNVSTYAMVILLLFNDVPTGESLTFEGIQERTRIPEHDLIRNLQSLAVAPKTRVLKKEPMSKDVKPTDKFFFNNDFQSQFMKVRIGVVSGGANKVENQDQRKETEGKMNEERGASVEAAVVRIMKQRKTLVHSSLMSEVLSQLSSRFVPDVNMVKKRIESLIDREYLERVAEEPPTYGYIA